MGSKITLNRETFKALAIDTRVKILKKLDENYQLTLTDLADELDLAPSTIKEHLDKLLAVGLIKQVDRGTKWKYYRLTSSGKQILNPYEKRVWIVLAVGTLLLFASLYRLIFKLQDILKPARFLSESMSPQMDSVQKEKAASGLSNGAQKFAENATTTTAEKAAEAASSTTSTTLEAAREAAEAGSFTIPYADLVLVLFSAVVVGVCIGYLIRRKGIL